MRQLQELRACCVDDVCLGLASTPSNHADSTCRLHLPGAVSCTMCAQTELSRQQQSVWQICVCNRCSLHACFIGSTPIGHTNFKTSNLSLEKLDQLPEGRPDGWCQFESFEPQYPDRFNSYHQCTCRMIVFMLSCCFRCWLHNTPQFKLPSSWRVSKSCAAICDDF